MSNSMSIERHSASHRGDSASAAATAPAGANRQPHKQLGTQPIRPLTPRCADCSVTHVRRVMPEAPNARTIDPAP
jgi:hypothetical protein